MCDLSIVESEYIDTIIDITKCKRLGITHLTISFDSFEIASQIKTKLVADKYSVIHNGKWMLINWRL